MDGDGRQRGGQGEKSEGGLRQPAGGEHLMLSARDVAYLVNNQTLCRGGSNHGFNTNVLGSPRRLLNIAEAWARGGISDMSSPLLLCPAHGDYGTPKRFLEAFIRHARERLQDTGLSGDSQVNRRAIHVLFFLSLQYWKVSQL